MQTQTQTQNQIQIQIQIQTQTQTQIQTQIQTPRGIRIPTRPPSQGLTSKGLALPRCPSWCRKHCPPRVRA